jgi:hypothetical protein
MHQTHPPADTPNNILFRVCKHLQHRDTKNGFRGNNYMESYWDLITRPSQTTCFTITDILDDAWNCNLITDQEYQYILNSF